VGAFGALTVAYAYGISMPAPEELEGEEPAPVSETPGEDVLIFRCTGLRIRSHELL